MIGRQLPPVQTPKTSATPTPGGHAFADMEITDDLISMGPELGCPFLSGLKRPEFAATEGESESNVDFCRSATSAAASAAVAGSFGLAGVAGACPHMKSDPQ